MSLFRDEKIADPQLFIDSAALLATTATTGSGTLPANPVGFIIFKSNGTTFKIPYYNA